MTDSNTSRFTVRNVLIYGATGYTGRLIARLAVEQGLRPVLAGRNRNRVQQLAGELGLPWRAFSLDARSAMEQALEQVSVVLHCAGPFAYTSKPMVDACLRTGTHYVDLAGEIRVLRALMARDAEARLAGIMLLPGAGFDVVALDCLARHLKTRLPGAVRVALALKPIGGFRPTRGTAASIVEAARPGATVRRGGALTPVPLGWKSRVVDFGDGPTRVATMPLTEVITVFIGTGIPDVEVYVAVPAAARWLTPVARYAGSLLASALVQRLLKGGVQLLPSGPSEEERQRTGMLAWGEVQDHTGATRVSRMRTPNPYTFTAQAALAIVRQVLGGEAPPGFQTPSLAYGPNLVLQIEGVERTDQG